MSAFAFYRPKTAVPLSANLRFPALRPLQPIPANTEVLESGRSAGAALRRPLVASGGPVGTTDPSTQHSVASRLFDRQAAHDWETFLTLRSAEMRQGARLVVALPSLDHDGSAAFAALWDHALAALSELVATGAITQEERRRMTIGACPRRERDLLEPFAADAHFKDLTVQGVSTLAAPDVAWADYERNGDAMSLASKRALFFRVIFVPTLAEALTRSRSSEDRRIFAERLEEGVRRRIAHVPARLDHLVGIIALAKQTAN
jgi:hypothetical protein